MIDSGASTRFVSQEWVQQNKLTIKPTHTNWTVTVANNETVTIMGTTDVTINIQGYQDQIKLLVMPMSSKFDIILGTDWAQKRGAILNYHTNTVSVHHKGRLHVLHPTARVPSTQRSLQYPSKPDQEEEDQPNFTLSYAQGSRVMKTRTDWYPIQVQHVQGSETWTELEFAAAKAKTEVITPEQQAADVQAAINDLKASVAANNPPPPEQRAPTPADEQQSKWLDTKVQELITTYGDQVFREKLPGIRQQGENVEAIPTTPGAKPPTRGLGRYIKHDKDELDKQITTLLKDGMIEPSMSPYAAAAMIVPKYNPDGSIKAWRMVIDYRLLNTITVKFQFPMPRIDDVLDSVNGAIYYSSCDATWGFWQIRLHPSDIPKTAFRTPTGLYQWRVLPFGLSNSPAVFQRTMSSFFQKAFTYPDGTSVTALGSFIQVYMDDLLIYSKTAADHLLHLDFVFSTLRSNGIYLNPKKCEFNKPEVRFLGHLVSRHGVRPDPCKVSVMKDWPAPLDKNDMYRFLGFANYFRQYIRSYATLAAPLYPLTQCTSKEDFATKWASLQVSCFEAIKLALISAPTLKLPDFDTPFEVIVDASNVAVGAVLIQDNRPVAYESKKLSTAQQKWTTTERELFAAVHALRQWRCYLQHPSFQFTLWTDHNPNTFFSTTHRPLSPRQARWQEFMGPFNFEWRYKKGPDNIADALTRLPGTAEVFSMIQLNAQPTTIDLNSMTTKRTKRPPRFALLQAQAKRRKAVRVRFADLLVTSEPQESQESSSSDSDSETDYPNTAPEGLTPFETTLWHHKEDPFFVTHSNRDQWIQDSHGIWRDSRQRLVIPTKKLHKQVLKACHDTVFSGHFGAERTKHLVQRLFYWPGMGKHIKDYCDSCLKCQAVKPTNKLPLGALLPLPVPTGKWTDVTVDMITGLPKTKHGFDAILVFVDRLTKMTHIVPTTETMDSEDFCWLLARDVIRLHGAPLTLISDRGSIFHSRYAQTWTADMGTWQRFSSAYHPQTDGQTERTNRVLEDVLRCFADTNQTDWDTYLPMAEFAMNNSPNAATRQTPFMLNYGVNPRHPDVIRLVRLHHNNILASDLRQQHIQLNAVAAMRSTMREVHNVPAASEFSTAMKKAISHTKILLQEARQRMQQFTDEKRTTNISFNTGDKVMVSTKHLKLLTGGCNKLLPRYVGPFTVTAVINPVAYRLDLPSTMRVHNVFHISLLKLYTHRPGASVHPEPMIIDGNEEYEVEVLLSKREKTVSTKKATHSENGRKPKKVMEYLVKWKNYGPEHNQQRQTANNSTTTERRTAVLSAATGRQTIKEDSPT